MDNMIETTAVSAEEAKVQYIIIKIGLEQYGIDIKYVDNIVRMQKITRVPKSQPYFDGVINLRGEIVPVMSLRKRFHLEADEFTSKTRIIILKPEQQEAIGVIVDGVNEVESFAASEIAKSGIDNSDERARYLMGVTSSHDSDTLVSILNVENVITEAKEKEQQA